LQWWATELRNRNGHCTNKGADISNKRADISNKRADISNNRADISLDPSLFFNPKTAANFVDPPALKTNVQLLFPTIHFVTDI